MLLLEVVAYLVTSFPFFCGGGGTSREPAVRNKSQAIPFSKEETARRRVRGISGATKSRQDDKKAAKYLSKCGRETIDLFSGNTSGVLIGTVMSHGFLQLFDFLGLAATGDSRPLKFGPLRSTLLNTWTRTYACSHQAVELLWVVSAWIPECRPSPKAMRIEKSDDCSRKDAIREEANHHKVG